MTEPATTITIETIARLSRAQQEALGLIAIGQDNLATLRHRRAVQALADAGLIEARDEPHYGDPSRGPMYALPLHVTRYDMPIHVHIAWCAWATEQARVDDDDADA